jgi:hypothetical protein
VSQEIDKGYRIRPTRSYSELFLPRTLVAVVKKLFNITVLGIGIGIVSLMLSDVLATAFKHRMSAF